MNIEIDVGQLAELLKKFVSGSTSAEEQLKAMPPMREISLELAAFIIKHQKDFVVISFGSF